MTKSPPRLNMQKLMPLLIVAAGLLAYSNSFTGAFVFDDGASIRENPTIRHFWPIWQPLSPPHRNGLTVEGRPLINLSLAINYAVGGYAVWGYHTVNLMVHILAGLALFGIIRRTLLQPALRGRFGGAANELALATAVLWTVHPLQTESVTYIIQRAESIMGLFYLLTLYCFIRGAESERARLWYGLSVTACALGMASKEVMVSAPLIVLFYDRAFLSHSFREAWRRRWPLYLALASTWMILVCVLVLAGLFAFASMSAQHHTLWQYLATLSTVPLQVRDSQRLGFTWWQYLVTEPKVILYYLRLSVWPSPLCIRHPWRIAEAWGDILPPAALLVTLLAAAVWAWERNPASGFLGVWFFLTLAPTSSVIPLEAVFFEHRMYLSLAAVVSLAAMGLYSLMGRRCLVVLVLVAVGFGFLAWHRNQDYRSEITLWRNAVAKFPNWAETHNNLAIALAQAGKTKDAIGHFEEALRLKPSFVEAHNNLAVMLLQAGRVQEAATHWQQALRADPHGAETLNNYGVVLRQMGRTQEAIRCYREALRMRPDYTEAHYNLAVTLEQAGQYEAAIEHYEQVLQSDSENVTVQYRLGVALWQTGRMPKAIQHFKQAVRINPDFAVAQNTLAWLLATLAPAEGGDAVRAVTLAQRACELTDNRVAAYLDTLAAAYAAAGRLNDAIATALKAVELAQSDGETQLAKEIGVRLELYRAGHAYHLPAGMSRH